MTTIQEARAIIQSGVTAAWQAAAVSTGVELQYDDTKSANDGSPGEDGATANPLPYARSSVRIVDGAQSTMGARRRFRSEGVATVQIFTPRNDGHVLGDQLAKVVLDFFRNYAHTPGGVWFFDAHAIEVGVTGAWSQINAKATFRFQESN